MALDSIQSISDYDAIKILSDRRRLAILRALMGAPATLTQLGKAMDLHPARVRYHLKLLEQAGLVRLTYTQTVGNYTEKYYQATATAFNIQVSVLPQIAGRDAIIVCGSHDLALELLAKTLFQDDRLPAVYTLPVGSLDGLIALRQELCHMAGCHLLDPLGGEYNTSYVRHLFPGQPMHMITLAHRQQGLLVAPGNPHNIQGINDLARGEITLVNRVAGSGTRLWLDQQLQIRGLDSTQIAGYDYEVNTHTRVAEMVLAGKADLGLAVLAAARKHNLDFIPLFEERFDLIIAESAFSDPLCAPLFDALNTAGIRRHISGLEGYKTSETGREIQVNQVFSSDLH